MPTIWFENQKNSFAWNILRFPLFSGVESSTCSDKWEGYDPWAYTLQDYWHQGSTTDDKLFKSKVACENKEIFNTGYSLSEALMLALTNPWLTQNITTDCFLNYEHVLNL
jgi:hypothetical protein